MRSAVSLCRLWRMAFANVGDYVRFLPSGEVVLKRAAIKRGQAAGLVRVDVSEFVEDRHGKPVRVRRVSIRMCDKVGALEHLLNVFQEMKSTGGK